MRAEDVWHRANEIASWGDGDPEIAHGAEDDLARDVLAAIANDECDDATACARHVAELMNQVRTRWYA